MERTYWCVMSEFYDDGTVKAAMLSRVCEEKPESTYRKLPRMDAYNDWFDTATEAETALMEARLLNKKQGAVA
jgi:transcription elongation factor Elf1